jgi:cytochrome c oxidase subunit 1
MYPEMWGRAGALIIFIGFNLTFFPQFILGYLGMPRRYQSYPPEFQVWHVLSSAGASILAVGYALPLFYFAWSILKGPRAPANPWNATGLEWSTRSPPPVHNFPVQPTVIRPAYRYERGKPCMQAGDG